MTFPKINYDETGAILQPKYSPEGPITEIDEAIDVVTTNNPQSPHPSSPNMDFEVWEYVINQLSPEMFTEIANRSSFDDRSACFKTLSLRFDEKSPYEVSDIINVDVSGNVSEKQIQEYTDHVENSFEYVVNVLPPVTSALLGGWLGQVRVFDREFYLNEFLPEGYRWGGMHYPYRREIQVAMSCYNCFEDPSKNQEYPSKNNSFSCTFIHELGHSIHNMYGFYRPGDSGYDYPSKHDSMESTGCLTPHSPTDIQAEFILDMIRSYALNHREDYNDVHRRGYGRTHPAETFACAFELLLRRGEVTVYEEYPHIVEVLSHMK